MQIKANIDCCNDRGIQGWLLVADDPERKPRVEILYRGTVLGECAADEFREDLRVAGIGDGRHGFSFSLPEFFPQSEVAHLRVRIQGTEGFISTKVADAPEAEMEAVSCFGGLWIDRMDWIDQLALRHRRGDLSDELTVIIFRFVRDDYVIFEKAVPLDLVDRVNQDIDAFWTEPPPGLLIETFEPDDVMKYIPPDKAYWNGRTKLLDTYAFSANVRAAHGRTEGEGVPERNFR